MSTSPHSELQARLALRRAEVARLERRDAYTAHARLFTFALAMAAALGWRLAHVLSPAWLLPPLLAFLGLLTFHDRVLRALGRARRSVAFHEDALSRLGGRVSGPGELGLRFAREEHPYALDLDLFGEGSLFHLLCTARTRPGEERLADWLLDQAGADEVGVRQRAVKELAPRLDLREDLAVLGEDVAARVDAGALAAWGKAAPALGRSVGPLALLSAAACLSGGALWAAGAGPLPFLAAVVIAASLRRALRRPLGRVLGGLDRPSAELAVLSALLARLEREPFQQPRLCALRDLLRAGKAPASRRIAELTRVVARLEWARNQLFAPVAFLMHWTVLHAVAVERWRAGCGQAVGIWLDTLAELEALSALAGYAHARPEQPFPELVTRLPGAPAFLVAEALRHPLLKGAVANDVRLGEGGPAALLVSGSNMSGKSTYLRTVGVAVVLAQAGAPVAAKSCRLTPLVPGATLRIQDSLQAGRSRFYAEITRLRALQDLATGPNALLFLLDEILHGTNSRDRLVGAKALVAGFVGTGAIGLVTTHDLALTELEEATIANAHFEDQVVDGRIAFDFRLRPGVSTQSNALGLMRAVGLRV